MGGAVYRYWGEAILFSDEFQVKVDKSFIGLIAHTADRGVRGLLVLVKLDGEHFLNRDYD